jgi:hypothetical protein
LVATNPDLRVLRCTNGGRYVVDRCRSSEPKYDRDSSIGTVASNAGSALCTTIERLGLADARTST